jgi:hypothetical protein
MIQERGGVMPNQLRIRSQIVELETIGFLVLHVIPLVKGCIVIELAFEVEGLKIEDDRGGVNGFDTVEIAVVVVEMMLIHAEGGLLSV